MNELTLILKGKPEPQQRARITKWGSYDPSKNSKLWIKTQMQMDLEGKDFKMILEPVELIILFHMPIPASTSNKRKTAMLNGEIKHVKKTGDLDNLYKKITDSMNELIYKDDSQIWRAEMEKIYSEDPRTEITLIW